jgi:DNA (cytosine-5)-methyltransferase 1
MNRPVCIDLFAGVGGLSLGFEQAGFDVACAVEIDPVHSAAHRFNFPDTPVICGSVTELTGAEIRRRSGLGDGKVDVVVGGPPCQGFSMIGKRALEDDRNALVGHFMRIVCELGASYFVMENVKGLTIGKHRQFLDEVVEEFQKAGYDVLVPWKVLNAGWFGVPQHRERLFLLGAKKGLPLPSYPEPFTNLSGKKALSASLPAGPTVADALYDLPDAEDFEALRGGDAVRAVLSAPSPYAAVLRGIVDDPEDYSHRRRWNSEVMTASTRSDHNEVSRRRFAETANGAVEPVSRFLKLDPAGVCNTLRAGTDEQRGAFTAARPIHPVHPRCITVREMARLHGYPDWFRFNWTKWHGAREVGNSVPPGLGRAVGTRIVAALGITPSRPDQIVELGDESFVLVDKSSATALLSKDLTAY